MPQIPATSIFINAASAGVDAHYGAAETFDSLLAAEGDTISLDVVASGGAGDCASGFFTSGECYCLHPWIDNHLFHLLRFDQERLKNALVEAGAAKYLFNRERALGNVGRVFEQADIARKPVPGERGDEIEARSGTPRAQRR